MVADPMPLLTVGEIFRRASKKVKRSGGLRQHQVEYLLKKRGIQPTGKAGPAYVYSEADLDYVVAELRRLERERQGAGI